MLYSTKVKIKNQILLICDKNVKRINQKRYLCSKYTALNTHFTALKCFCSKKKLSAYKKLSFPLLPEANRQEIYILRCPLRHIGIFLVVKKNLLHPAVIHNLQMKQNKNDTSDLVPSFLASLLLRQLPATGPSSQTVHIILRTKVLCI